MTNREKFEEVFNYHPDLSFCPIYCTYEDTECTNFTKDREQNNTCGAGEWWELEYQEPKQSKESFQWCTDCKEYNQEKHCCHRYSKVIRRTVEEMKQESRWTPVEESLPKEGEKLIDDDVLVLCEDRQIRIGFCMGTDLNGNREWCVGGGYSKVIAWMPLPTKPYEGVEE